MKTTLVVGDVHGVLPVVSKALNHEGPVVFLGDLVDSYDRTIVDQLDCVRLVLEAVRTGKATLIAGNHEHCVSEDTEVLTETRGWVSIPNVTLEDRIASLDLNGNVAAFQQPISIHSYKAPITMRRLKTCRIDQIITENHRILHKGHANGKISDWRFKTPDALRGNATIPTSALSGKPEYPLDDNTIRIVAWFLTDGGFARTKYTVTSGETKESTGTKIYQRLSKVGLITNILDLLEAEYVVRTRDRRVAKVCGRELVKPNEKSCEVSISGELRETIKKIVSDKYSIPSWVMELSDRQFMIFLSSFVDGDGSRHKSAPQTSWMAYGQEKILSQLQAACVVHGVTASLVRYRKIQWRLNICPSIQMSWWHPKRIPVVSYAGSSVFCLTMPHGNFLMRRDGLACFTGNSYLSKDQRCSGFNPILNMQLRDHGYLEEIRKVAKTHVWLGVSPSWGGYDPILLSHAGFSFDPTIFQNFHLNIRNPDFDRFAKAVAEAAKDQNSWFYWIGKIRGGWRPIGGPLWCHAPTEFVEIPGIRQIFGHTPMRTPCVFYGGSLCINVQDGNFVGVEVTENGRLGKFVFVQEANDEITES